MTSLRFLKYSAKMIHFTAFTTIIILSFCSQTSADSETFQRLESLHYCKYDDDCNENAFCFGNDGVNRGKCRCRDNHVMLDRNRTYYECLPFAEGIDSPCLKDVQCQVNLGMEGICDESKKVCQCSPNSNFGDAICHKNVALGEICTSNYNCRLGDGTFGFCITGRCSCDIQHHPTEDGQRCIRSVPLGKSCETSESCTHIFANCYGGICKCRGGFIESEDRTVCLKAAGKVGESCEQNVQCSAYITGAFCFNETCSCKSAHHGYGNECVPDAKLGDRCTQHKECIISADLEYSVRCTSGVCTCVEGVSDENSYGCILVPNGSKRKYKPIFLLALLAVVFSSSYFEATWF